MERKQELVAAVAAATDEGDYEQLEVLLQRQLTRNDDFNIQEVMDYMDSKEHEELWVALRNFCRILLNALRLGGEEDEEEESGSVVEGAEEMVQSLHRIASMLVLYVVDSAQHRPPSLFATLAMCHDVLIPLNDDIPGASFFKSAVARCCETWWVKEEPGAENLITQLIPFNLLTALGPNIVDADVKRCWTIRGSLLLLDFDDPSIESIRGLLLRCVVHPGFLKVAEGRRFLSFLFSVKSNLVPLLINVMKPNIASGIKSVASAYGEVIYRAWKESERTPSLQAAIEDCIQKLAHETMLATDRKYFRGLRIALGAIHDNKRIKGVDTMLLRAYGPILWRSLRCANALVRAQATMLFFDAFPLQDSDAGNVESDAVLQKQFDLLSSLLKDEDHRVREASVSGVFHILGEYWEALPLNTTRQILSYVVGTLGVDASCVDVRLALVHGMHKLLDQPLAHGVLAGLLPLLKNTIHDNALAVRVKFLQVLDKVKGIKDIHFYDIVPEENLLAQFAEDANKPAAAEGFTRLLLNSFYPREENGSSSTQMNFEQKLRCVKFVRMNVDAAVVFYSNLHKFVSVGSATKLCAMLFVLLRQPVANRSSSQDASNDLNPKHPLAARAKRRRDRELARRQEGEDDAEEKLSGGGVTEEDVFDIPTRVGVLRVVLGCFSSIATILKKDIHEPSREFIGRHMNSAAVLEVFKTVEPSETNADVESLPLLLQLISLINDVRAVHEHTADGQAITTVTPVGLSFDNVLVSFTRAWQSINTDETIEESMRETRLKQQAAACIDVVCALGKMDALVQEIGSNFKNFPTSSRKKVTVTASMALDLLDAILNATEQQGAVYTARNDLVRAFGSIEWGGADADLLSSVRLAVQSASESMNFSVLTPTELLRYTHLIASAAVSKTTLASSDEDSDIAAFDPLNQLADWVTEFVIPCIRGKKLVACAVNDAMFTSSEYFQLTLASILAVFSDCLILDLSSHLVEDAIERWMQSLVDAMQNDGLIALPVLVPIVGRLCCVSKVTNEKAFELMWELLLRHLAITNESESACARKLVFSILKGANCEVVKMTTDFIIKAIKTSKMRGGAEKLTWGESNASSSACLELLKETSRAGDACVHIANLLSAGEEDKGHTLLLSELFLCPTLKANAALQKSVFDEVVGIGNKGGESGQRIIQALQGVHVVTV